MGRIWGSVEYVVSEVEREGEEGAEQLLVQQHELHSAFITYCSQSA